MFFTSENSKRSDIPRIFKPEDEDTSEGTETSQSAESSQSSDAPSSGSGDSASYDATKEAKEESSGQNDKRNIIPTEVFEEGSSCLFVLQLI